MRSRFTSNSNFGPKIGLIGHFRQGLATACMVLAAASPARADLPTGSKAEAEA
jgi:hypothetical protein